MCHLKISRYWFHIRIIPSTCYLLPFSLLKWKNLKIYIYQLFNKIHIFGINNKTSSSSMCHLKILTKWFQIFAQLFLYDETTKYHYYKHNLKRNAKPPFFAPPYCQVYWWNKSVFLKLVFEHTEVMWWSQSIL